MLCCCYFVIILVEPVSSLLHYVHDFLILQVKAIYVKNLPENVSSERLKELFELNGEVTKVVLPPAKAGQGKRDFGFVHFADRSSALKAVKATEKFEIDGKCFFIIVFRCLKYLVISMKQCSQCRAMSNFMNSLSSWIL